MAKNRKKILILTAPEGHFSIAQSIEQTLSPDYEIKVVKADEPWMQLYRPIYILFPELYQIPFNISAYSRVKKTIRSLLKRKYQRTLRKLITTYKPDLIISTFMLFNPALEEIISKNGTTSNNIPFINVITDPRTVHPTVIAESATVNVAFDDTQIEYMKTVCPDAAYEKLGWFVRDQYVSHPNPSALRTELGLDPNQPTFLVTGGSEGTAHILKILPFLIMNKTPLQLIVACGASSLVHQSVQAIEVMARTTNPALNIIPLQFTENFHQYIQASDVVIGKAGPNTLFEAVAAHKPFVAITHIAGQENGNLDLIRDLNLGIVEENVTKLHQVLQRLITHPQDLAGFKSGLKKLATYNRQTPERLRRLVKKLI